MECSWLATRQSQNTEILNKTAIQDNTTGISINANTAADASSSHENLPPYIAKYIWQRTA